MKKIINSKLKLKVKIKEIISYIFQFYLNAIQKMRPNKKKKTIDDQ